MFSEVPKRLALLVSVCVVLTVLALVVTSFSLRIVFSVLVLLTAAIIFFSRRKDTNRSNPLPDLSQSPESFAVSSLFEATMGSMREGLLVVDKDMRVVASNPAAHRLFSPTLPKLNSQRLTELTRNPAIYSAFLDGLKGVESSGIKVETHGPERQVFDLRVVPIGGKRQGT